MRLITSRYYRQPLKAFTFVLLGCFAHGTAFAEESASASAFDDIPEFGGPSTVGADLKEDAKPKQPAFRFESIDSFLKPYFDSKAKTAKESNFAYGFDYTAMYQNASDSLGEDDAGGGIFRAFGSWTLTGLDTGNTGTLVYKVEHRNRLGTDISPSSLGFETGYVGLTAPIYSNYKWGLTNLYWQQKFKEAQINFVAGVVDVTDYLDIYGLINPWTSFSNLAFLTNASIPSPNPGLGGALGWQVSDNIYIVGGVADANGDPSKPEDAIDSFFDDSELFKHVEISYVSSFDRRYFDNIHLTLWQVDEKTNPGNTARDGWGWAFSYAWFIDDTWMPFVRAGYADEGGALYDKNVSVGFGHYLAKSSDLLGVGLNWSEPSETTFGPGLRDQYTIEAYYRYQLAKNLALTPDIQYIIDPANNTAVDDIWILGLRMRLSL